MATAESKCFAKKDIINCHYRGHSTDAALIVLEQTRMLQKMTITLPKPRPSEAFMLINKKKLKQLLFHRDILFLFAEKALYENKIIFYLKIENFEFSKHGNNTFYLVNEENKLLAFTSITPLKRIIQEQGYSTKKDKLIVFPTDKKISIPIQLET